MSASSSFAFSMKDLTDCWNNLKDGNLCDCPKRTITGNWQPDDLTIEQLSKDTYKYDSTDSDFTVPSFPSDWEYSYSYRANLLCPPYNKRSGRKGCLIQFAPPSSTKTGGVGTEVIAPNSFNYSIYCAEAVPTTSFKRPLIKIRIQNCNFIYCWTTTKNLNGRLGQCATFPSPYGLPMTRFCARLALARLDDSVGLGRPQDITLNPDPGYKFHFLDTHGFPRPDPGIPISSEVSDALGSGVTGKQRIFLPKLCLYEDPSIFQTVLAFMNPWYRDVTKQDIYDTSPNKMIYHNKGPGSNPITPSVVDTMTGGVFRNEVVETNFFFKAGVFDSLFYPGDFANTVTKYDPTADGTTIFGYKVDMRWKDGDDEYINWVKDFVYNKQDSLGCVFFPLGPYPPPFCSKPPPLPLAGNMHEICSPEIYYDESTQKETVRLRKSTITSQCVKSIVKNNFIYNSARISIDNIVPICSDASQNPMGSDNCVRFYPTGLTALYIHDNLNDTIPICSSADPTDGNPCVITKYASSCVGKNCSDNMRVAYSYQYSIADEPIITYGYAEDAEGDCSTGAYPCASLYGINAGSYTDVSVDLSNSSNVNSDGYTTLSVVTLSDDSTDKTLTFTPYISYLGKEYDIDLDDVSLEGNSICATYPDGQYIYDIGCVDRASLPKLTTSSNSSSTFTNPLVNVTLSYGGLELGTGMSSLPTESVSSTVAANDMNDGPYGDPERLYYNIIGAQIDTLVTHDESLATYTNDFYPIPPYYGTQAYPQGQSTIYGYYKNLSSPIKSDGTYDETAKYLAGLEYVGGQYSRGGKKIGVAYAPIIPCHTRIEGSSADVYDDSNCVLTKRNYQDKLNCKDFDALKAPYPCTSAEIAGTSEHSCSKSSDESITLNDGRTVSIYLCGYESTNTYQNERYKCYSAPDDLPKLFCAASTDPSDRIIPSYDKTNLKTQSYYSFESDQITTGICATSDTGKIYNEANCIVRTKTIFEIG
ncbi:MAG: hypothetical protein SFT91_06435, partial [Rickettsiaceae bacterium]|nr:hypothetical protein [Rickettsiaceae bacterium]